MSNWYRLNGDIPVLIEDPWAPGIDVMGDPQSRTLARDEIPYKDGVNIVISTVFLALDHGWDNGPPVLWETLVFDGPLADHMDRYTSADDARAGHERIKADVLAAINQESAPNS